MALIKIELATLSNIFTHDDTRPIIEGDFNAKNPLWGSENVDIAEAI